MDIDIETFADLCMKFEGKKDIEIVNALIAMGIEEQQAQKYVILTPIAFGRCFLAKTYPSIKFSELYHVRDTEARHPFVQDEIYKWAYELGLKTLEGEVLAKEKIQPILHRSPEIMAFVKVKAAQKEVAGLKFDTTISF